nr:MAG TPA: hypothetical protein [Caudoviricetes sp.]
MPSPLSQGDDDGDYGQGNADSTKNIDCHIV